MSICDFTRSKDSLYNHKTLCDLVNNEKVNISNGKGKIDVENDENSSCNDGSEISYTTSPVVLYVRPDDHSKEKNSALQNKSDLGKKSEHVRNCKRPFSCIVCGKAFKRKGHCDLHLRGTHTTERPYKCKICGKAFKRKSYCDVHLLTTHNTERPYKCKICDKAFTHQSLLRGHEDIHNTVKQFTCKLCNQEFSVRRYYAQHIRRHVKQSYECDACDFICSTLKESNAHVKTHGANIYMCSKCDRYFCQELSLNLHLCIQSDKKSFSCKLCAKTFRKKSELDRHMAKHENKKSVVCDICKLRFNTKQNLSVHVQTVHEEEHPDKPYTCDKCDKKFHLQLNLRKHKRVHTRQEQRSKIGSVSQHQSPINQKLSSVSVGQLQIDTPVPTEQPVLFIPDDINFVCGICLKGFKNRYRLNVHYRRHIGAKPYKCNDCDKCFYESSSLIRHCRTHPDPGELKYGCAFCNRTFIRKYNMKKHSLACAYQKKNN